MIRINYKEIIIKKIIDPDDIIYPLSCDLFGDPKVLYHGTSSKFSKNIETNGWRINDQPYAIDDVGYICNISEILFYFGGGYSILRPFTLGTSNAYLNKKRASFTSNYWMARRFASVEGGETINAIFYALKEFKDLLNSEEKIQNHINSLKVYYDKFKDMLQNIRNTNLNIHIIKDNYNRYKKAIEMSNNNKFLRITFEKCQKLLEKYRPLVENVYGVVYVLKIRPEWFENWIIPYNSATQTDYLAAVDIESESIIAKVEFPNGITNYFPASNHPLPLPWALDEFKKYLSENYYAIKNTFLEKYIHDLNKKEKKYDENDNLDSFTKGKK